MTFDEQKITDELHSLALRVSGVEALAEENKGQNDTIIANTDELLKLFNACKGAFTVLDGIGKVAKPILWLVALFGTCSAGWLWIKQHM